MAIYELLLSMPSPYLMSTDLAKLRRPVRKRVIARNIELNFDGV